jgi:hypothetical protein
MIEKIKCWFLFKKNFDCIFIYQQFLKYIVFIVNWNSLLLFS